QGRVWTVVDHQQSMFVDVPIKSTFGHLCNHRSVPNWMFAVPQSEPTGQQNTDVGTVLEAAMQVSPTTVAPVLRITEWMPNKLLSIQAIEGFPLPCRWQLSSAGQHDGRLTTAFNYQSPGCPAGNALDQVLGPFA